MYGHQHSLVQKPSPSKIAFGLTLPKLISLLIGAKLSYDFSQAVPALPVKNFIIAHIHHFIPLVLCASFAFVNHSKTGLPLPLYLWNLAKFKLRRRVFLWRKG